MCSSSSYYGTNEFPGGNTVYHTLQNIEEMCSLGSSPSSDVYKVLETSIMASGPY